MFSSLSNMTYVYLAGFFFSILCFLFISFLRKVKQETKDAKEKAKFVLEESLDLATSEQLIVNLRKRVRTPYILLTPILDNDSNGMSVEIHDVDPAISLGILKNAFLITARELKGRGYDIDSVLENDDDEEDEYPEQEQF